MTMRPSPVLARGLAGTSFGKGVGARKEIGLRADLPIHTESLSICRYMSDREPEAFQNPLGQWIFLMIMVWGRAVVSSRSAQKHTYNRTLSYPRNSIEFVVFVLPQAVPVDSGSIILHSVRHMDDDCGTK